MAQKTSKSLTPRGRFWREHVQQWGRSSATHAQYCKEHKLSVAAFRWWRRKLVADRLAAFLDRLHGFFEKASPGFQYAVETRNPNYLKDELTNALRQLGLGFVLLDGYYMPRIAEVAVKLDIRTAPFSIIRLHGPDRAGIEEQTGGVWDKIIEPKDDGLTATAEVVRGNVDAGVDTYANVNNHYEGSALLTIGRLLEVLRQDPVR